ncbi:hypothetical protein SBADM41S_02022 [Streptomyces badius]
MSDRWDAAAFKTRVDEVLHQFVAREVDLFAKIDPSLAPVAAQLEAAVQDGKRLRAAFCYWGWRAVGQPDSSALLRAAASLELIHAAAVVHDDLIDDSALRHGRPTAHVALRGAVRRRPRSAAAARSLAMLVGDLLMGMAGQLFATSGLPAAYVGRARPLWSVLGRELIAGECLEILRTGSEPDTDASLQVIRYKTAKYTVEQPLLIGGALAGPAGGCAKATPPTACLWARRSSSGTTCSGCSETPSTPARPTRTTYAGNGPQRCWRRPGASPVRTTGPVSGPSWANVAWTKPGSKPCVR